MIPTGTQEFSLFQKKNCLRVFFSGLGYQIQEEEEEGQRTSVMIKNNILELKCAK